MCGKMKWTRVVMVAALVFFAALSLAPRGERRQRKEPKQRKLAAALAEPADLEAVDVQVIQRDDGVSILVTSRKADLAGNIKEVLPKLIKNLRERGLGKARAAATKGGDPGPEAQARRERARRGRTPLMADEGVKVEITQRDDGVEIVVTSEDPELVERIKEQMPRRVEMFRRLAARRRFGGDLFTFLLLAEKVNVELQEEADGMALLITSDDPEAIERIKAVMPRWLQMMRKRADRIKEMREKGITPQQWREQKRKEKEEAKKGGKAKAKAVDPDD